ncbi:DUF4870 domain-containing protein [Lederbergia graminis]|uniref:DUF4870 domain-containing protein n=1 Tax=Lederbergia graminis TaxID=735518 RepID=A0ABW0LHC2_9BACI|nr:DUF4870 domain-containing protein [Paenibacillus bovis]HLU21088.1 DUF4870 domain-containing protein [Bacillaceae bacterium]
MEEKNEIVTDENQTPVKSSTGLDLNVASLLCYLGTFVTGIIFLVLEKNSPVVKFHAMQSIVTFLGLMILGYALDYIPFLGWLVSLLVSFLTFIMWIFLMIKAYNNEMFRVPLASDLADNFLGKMK